MPTDWPQSALAYGPQEKGIKVVHLSSVHRSFDPRIYEKECRALAEAGYTVTLIATGDREEEHSGAEGILVRTIARERNRLLRILRGAWRVYRLAKREGASVYHAHDPELLPWLWLLQRSGRIVVYDMHENTPLALRDKLWLPAGVRSLLARVFRLIERVLLRSIPVVFAEQSYVRDYAWVNRYTVVQNMPRVEDMPQPRGAQRHSATTLVYAGSISAQRGSMVTLHALSILRRRGFDVRCAFIGPVSEGHGKELSSLIRRLELEGVVQFRGYVSPGEAWEFVSECHIGLAVLAPLANYVDSYPTKVFEYMVMGLPVIASDFPLYRSLIEGEGCGIVVDPESPKELADAVDQLSRDPERMQRMGARGRQAVQQRYNWKQEEGRLLAFYGRLLEEGEDMEDTKS